MNLNGPIYINMREIVKDIDVIVKELITVASHQEKTEEDRKLLRTLPRLFAKKEREYKQLCKIYQHRCKVKKYIEELEKVAAVQDRKLQLLSDGFGKMYNNLSELKRRVENQTGLNNAEVLLNDDDIVKAACLYSRSYSVCAPDKNPNQSKKSLINLLRPYPTTIELKKGRLAQMTAKQLAIKQQQQQQHQQPDIAYFSLMNTTSDLKDKLKDYPTLLDSSSTAITSYMEKYKQNLEKKPKSNKLWTHYRPSYEPVTVTAWNDKALNPQGYIETATTSNKKIDGKADNDDTGPRRPITPEYPMINLVPMEEKHSIFYKALIGGDEEDLIPNEEHLNPPSVQSCNMVEEDNQEIYERYQEIAEHSRQKYYNSFKEEEIIPWLQIPGKEKFKKKTNFRFRLTSPAYFGEQQRITKKIVWNAKYNRFYRNYKYRVPRLSVKGFTFPNPRRQNDPQHNLNQFEAVWNVRKWNLSTVLSTPNA